MIPSNKKRIFKVGSTHDDLVEEDDRERDDKVKDNDGYNEWERVTPLFGSRSRLRKE